MEGGDTLFGKIIRREIPSTIVYETETVLAFKDIQPQAPVHFLIIPKKPLRDLSGAEATDIPLLGELLYAANLLASKYGLDKSGYRTVINTGEHAGQTVFHLHVHLLGGRDFSWPPG